MINWAKQWVNVIYANGGFTSQADVLAFSLRMTLLVVVVADILDIVVHVSLDAAGLLPYPLVPATTIGVIITTILAGGLTFISSYLIGCVVLELSVSRAAFIHLSRTDMLSGLLNRRAFLETFEARPADASLVLFDIDHFKSVNDHHGHEAGDRVITAVARTLADLFDPEHVTARIGGEEFAVLIVGLTAAERLALAERARAKVARCVVDLQEGTTTVTISGGVAERTDHGTFTALFAATDRALYTSKTSGRNIVLHDRDIQIEPAANRH